MYIGTYISMYNEKIKLYIMTYIVIKCTLDVHFY